jgi:hypothetical protein
MTTRVLTLRYTVASLALAAAIALAGCSQLLMRWQTYVAPDGKFSVEMPGVPLTHTSEAPVPGRNAAVIHNLMVTTITGTAFMCSYHSNPNFVNRPPDPILEGGRDGAVKNVQGSIVSQKKLKVQDYPALEFQATARLDSTVDARMILVGDRMYMLLVVSPAKIGRDTKSITRMFDSFKVLKP